MNLSETAIINLKITSGEAKNELEALKQRTEELRASMKELEQAGQKGSDEWKTMRKNLSEVNSEMKNYTSQMDLSEATVGQLKAAQKQLNKEILETVQGTQDYIDKSKRLQEVNTRLQSVRQDVKAVGDSVDDSKTRFDRFRDAFSGAFAALSLENLIESVVDFGRQSIASAAKMTDAMSDIEKSTGMTTDEVRGLVDEINKIDTRTSTESLLEIAKVAGQLGVAKEEVVGFTKSVDMAVVALGDEFAGGAEVVASKLGTLKTIFKETKDLEAGDALNKIGSAINELGAAGSATGPVIQDFTQRMGQLGQLSPQITQTMGLGAAFQELGLSAEIAAGGLTNILLTAAKDVGPFAAQMKLSQQAVTDLINTNPNEFLLKLAESLRGLPADQVAKRLDDLGIKSQEATKVMSLLKDQTDLVRNRQETANKAFKDGTSLMAEFTKKNSNAAAELDKLNKDVANMSVQLGNVLLPIVIKVGTALVAFGKAIFAIPAFIKENRVELALLAIGLATINGNLIAATASSLAHAAAEKGRLLWTQAGVVAQTALNAVMNANPIARVVAVAAALAAGFVALYNRSETFRQIVGKLWEYLKQFAAFVGPMLSGPLAIIESVAKSVGSVLGIASDEAKKANKAAATDHQKTLADKAKAEADAKALEKKQHDDLLAAKRAASNQAAQQGRADNKKTLDEKEKDEETSIKNTLKNTRDAQVAAETDELKRNKLKLDFEYADELAAIKKSLASRVQKEAETVAAKKKYDAEAAKIETEAAAREAKLRTEKEKAERETTDRIVKNEREAVKNLLDFEAAAVKELETNNANFTYKQRQDLSKRVMDLAKARLLFEKTAALANANEIAEKELERENLTDKEKQSILAKRDTAKRLIEKKYLTDDAKATGEHADRLKKLDEDDLKAKQARRKGFSDGFQALLKGDFDVAISLMKKQSSEEQTETQKRRSAFAADVEQKGQMAAAAVNFLNDLSKKRTEKEIANATKERDEKIKKLKEQFDKGLIDKKSYDAAVEAANKTAMAKEKAAKEQQWKNQQKADIAMAIINGLIGATKAFAQGGIFGAIGAAIVLVATGLSVAKIKSTPMPQFSYGTVVNGAKHASEYGKGGISLIDNPTGRNVGEMEGGEAIVNADVTEANMPVMNLFFRRARTRDRNKPVTISDMVKAGVAFRDGGVFESGYWKRQPYSYGGRKREREEAQRESENTSASGSEGAQGDVSTNGSSSGAMDSMAAESNKNSKDMVAFLKEISDTSKGVLGQLATLNEVRDAVNGTTGAVREEGQSSRAMMNVMSKSVS